MNPFRRIIDIFGPKPSIPPEGPKRVAQGLIEFDRGHKHLLERRDQEAVDCFDRAEDFFDSAKEIGFQSAELFAARGSCLHSLDWQLDAIDDFTKAISLDPSGCNDYFQRANCKGAAGDREGCIADLEEAIRLSKVDCELHREYGSLAKEKAWGKTVTETYERQLSIARTIADTPQIAARAKERTRLRGRRQRQLPH